MPWYQISFYVMAFAGYSVAIYQMGWAHGRSRGKEEQAQILRAGKKLKKKHAK